MVDEVAFAPDGKTLAMASREGSLLLWDVAGGNLLATLKGHSGAVSALVFSPDGRDIAIAGWGPGICVRSTADGRERFVLAGHRHSVDALAYSPDGRILVSGGENGTVKVWHLASRREVERVLAAGDVPVTSFRAAMIIGSGSASFEILRYLAERLPVLVTPRWVRTECQPISIRNVLHYLVHCLSVPATTGRSLEIGGADIVTYQDLLQVMAEERGIGRRLVVPVSLELFAIVYRISP